jgi:carbonic anhydrase
MNKHKLLTHAFSLPLMFAIVVLLFSLFFIAFGQEPPSSDEVVAMLAKGNERFATDHPSYPHEGAARRSEVVSGQHPLATIISCSDSRVPPEILFDEGLGDLFIVRVIGNVSRGDEAGSAEYGVEHLGTPLLVVLGHTGCGAVTAAVTHAKAHGHVPPLLTHIKHAALTASRERPELKGMDLVPEAIRANVFHSMEGPLIRSEIIRNRIHSGKLKVVRAIYDMKSGRVEWLGSHPRQDHILTHHVAHPPHRIAHRGKV